VTSQRAIGETTTHPTAAVLPALQSSACLLSPRAGLLAGADDAWIDAGQSVEICDLFTVERGF
jgi:hypothetical protein